MLLQKRYRPLLVVLLFVLSCKQQPVKQGQAGNNAKPDWKTTFNGQLALLGHRNWIVIADKAFPQQNAAGMEVINTDDSLLPVLKYVLQQVNASTHVRPIIYRDKELSFISEALAPGASRFVNEFAALFNGHQVQTILHDSVFIKLDQASKLFKVLVLKTNETIPYTSVFLQLDCAYWNAEKEAGLRKAMAK